MSVFDPRTRIRGQPGQATVDLGRGEVGHARVDLGRGQGGRARVDLGRGQARHARLDIGRGEARHARVDLGRGQAGRTTVDLARSQAGQATVEVVALLPVLAVLVAGAWQAVLAGHALWAATTAARAAARANAVGSDPREAARARLPGALERGLRVSAGDSGDVEVTVRIPSLPGLPSPGTAHAEARFEPQT